MKKVELKPCPFCGGAAEIVKADIYLTKGWRVKCKICKASSLPEYVDSPHMTAFGLDETTRYTEEQAKAIVAERWNRRKMRDECAVTAERGLRKVTNNAID